MCVTCADPAAYFGVPVPVRGQIEHRDPTQAAICYCSVLCIACYSSSSAKRI